MAKKSIMTTINLETFKKGTKELKDKYNIKYSKPFTKEVSNKLFNEIQELVNIWCERQEKIDKIEHISRFNIT